MIQVVTLNTLANVCADKSDYGFPHADEAILTWEYRAKLITQLLTPHVTNGAFFCLQEVDKIDFFKDLFTKHNYKCVMAPLKKGGHTCCIAWNDNLWALRQQKSDFYKGYTQKYIIVMDIECK